jgi:hypothetical protein
MSNNQNQVIAKRIITDVTIFTDKPTLEEIKHLKVCGFRYEKGQWSRSLHQSGLHPAAVVFEYTVEGEA